MVYLRAKTEEEAFKNQITSLEKMKYREKNKGLSDSIKITEC